MGVFFPISAKKPKTKAGLPIGPVVPSSLPGTFFVLQWMADAERFVLYVDDQDSSSYNVGTSSEEVLPVLRRLVGDYDSFAEECLDRAREFRTAKCVLRTRRVMAIHPKATKPELDWSGEVPAETGYIHV